MQSPILGCWLRGPRLRQNKAGAGWDIGLKLLEDSAHCSLEPLSPIPYKPPTRRQWHLLFGHDSWFWHLSSCCCCCCCCCCLRCNIFFPCLKDYWKYENFRSPLWAIGPYPTLLIGRMLRPNLSKARTGLIRAMGSACWKWSPHLNLSAVFGSRQIPPQSQVERGCPNCGSHIGIVLRT